MGRCKRVDHLGIIVGIRYEKEAIRRGNRSKKLVKWRKKRNPIGVSRRDAPERELRFDILLFICELFEIEGFGDEQPWR